MKNTLDLDFNNLVSELKSKELNLLFFKNGHFVEDVKGNLYSIDTYWHGSYLDRLIKNGNTIKFNLLENPLSQDSINCKKIVYDALGVKSFIEIHSL